MDALSLDPTLLGHPLTRTFILPLVVALLAGGLLLAIGARRVAVLGIVLGFLAAYVAIRGVPAFPPGSAEHRLVYLVLGGGVLGALFDGLRPGRAVQWWLIGCAALVGVGWIAWPRVVGASAPVVIMAAGAVAWSMVILGRLEAAGERGTVAPVMLLVAALGMAPLALDGASAAFAQLAGALAAAAGGFMLWNWPTPRMPFGRAGVLGGENALVLLGVSLAFHTSASVPALVMLGGVFFADAVAERVPVGRGLVQRLLAPVVLALVALVPAVAAFGLARLLASVGRPGDYY